MGGAVLGSGKFTGHDVSDFAKMMVGLTLPKVIRGMVSPDADLFGFKLKPRIHKGWLKFNTKLTKKSFKLLKAKMTKGFHEAIQHTAAAYGGYQKIGKTKMALPIPLP